MMLKINKFIIAFVLGIVVTLLLFWGFRKYFFNHPEAKNDYYIITNQISRMNKLVVLEQDFSKLQKNKYSYKFFGKSLSDKEIMTYVKTNVQVSYDLNKMKIEVDSIGKNLIIKEIPSPTVRITPNVEIHSIDDSFFNRIGDKEIKEIMQKAKADADRQINKQQLQTEGKQQLLENINQILILAKALNYKIIDKTGIVNIDWKNL